MRRPASLSSLGSELLLSQTHSSESGFTVPATSDDDDDDDDDDGGGDEAQEDRVAIAQPFSSPRANLS